MGSLLSAFLLTAQKPGKHGCDPHVVMCAYVLATRAQPLYSIGQLVQEEFRALGQLVLQASTRPASATEQDPVSNEKNWLRGSFRVVPSVP